MTRSYRVLALALVSIAVLVGLAKLIGRSSNSAADGGGSAVATATTASSGTSTTGTAPVDSATSTGAANRPAIVTTTADAGTSSPAAVGGITDADCPSSAHGGVIDRNAQRGALCDHGTVSYRFPITSARRQPDPGTYPVYARDMHTSSMFGGHYSTMTHFVAFTRGKYTHARIAFHSVPLLADGSFVQSLESVGSSDQWGNTSGCIHVIPTDAVKVWNWLALGDQVHVIN